MGKVDYNFGKQQISGRYFDTRFKQPPAIFTDNILAADSGGSQVHIHNVAVNHTFTARPTLLFNTWFGWNTRRPAAPSHPRCSAGPTSASR